MVQRSYTSGTEVFASGTEAFMSGTELYTSDTEVLNKWNRVVYEWCRGNIQIVQVVQRFYKIGTEMLYEW